MNQIEHVCKCGDCEWDGHRWRTAGGTYYASDYCPDCGYHLGDDGIARRTVVVPEEPVEAWLAAAFDDRTVLPFMGEPHAGTEFDSERQFWVGRHYLLRKRGEIDIEPGEKRRYYLIPVPQEGEDE